MKNILHCLLLLVILVLVRKIYLEPTDSTSLAEWKAYTGPRSGTKVALSIPLIQTEVNLPRFPGDMIVYSPLKLLPDVQVYVKETDEILPYHSGLKKAIPEKYSLAYSYLMLLDSYNVSLATKSTIKGMEYDFSNMTETPTIKPLVIMYHLMQPDELERFMTGIISKARVDLIRVSEPRRHGIVEVVRGEDARYLWIHAVDEANVYVVDPGAPQLVLAKVDRETKLYEVGTHTYKVRGYMDRTRAKATEDGGR